MTVAAMSSDRRAREGREAPAPWGGGSGAMHDACVMHIRKTEASVRAVPDLIRDLGGFEVHWLRREDGT